MAEEVGLQYKVSVEDGGEFIGTFKDLNGMLKNTQAELRALDKNLKIDPDNIELLTKKAKALDTAISLNQERAKKFKNELESLQKEDILDQKKYRE